MGVKGLLSFIFDNPQLGLLKPYKLHDSYIIIDGDNLIHSLYLDYKVNVICGGDYNEYAEHVRSYFCRFLQCHIKPIVVCDGGYDKSDRKMKTVFKRVYERLKNVQNISQNIKYSRRVLPILSHDVFICILHELQIPLVLCGYEADAQITALANYYKCPVISEDSDFIIFNVHNGFIITDSVESDITLGVDSNRKEYKYLNCYIYNVEEFVSRFPGIEQDVLPLFASLMGNDYVEQNIFANFLANIPLSTDISTAVSLLNWLKGKSLSEATSQILQFLDKEEQDYVKALLETSIASYDLQNCNLQYFVDQKLNGTRCKFLFESGLMTPCGNSLPYDFLVKYHSGCLSSLFPNIIVSHKSFLMPQIDEFSFCSSYMCARYIRRVIYGILIRHDVDGNPCQNDKCLAPIEEYDRHEDRFDKELVEPVFCIQGYGMLPKISELSNLKKVKGHSIIKTVFGLSLGFMKDLPEEWKLFFGSINYFLYNSIPSCTDVFLYALILNLIYCDIITHKNPYQNLVKCCKKCIKGFHSSIKCTLGKINESELLHAAENFNMYLSEPYVNRYNPLRAEILHSYSQLQSCVRSAVLLNKLLGLCYKNPDIHKLFNGSMLYNLTKEMSTWSNTLSFVAGILGSKTTLFKLFMLLDSKLRFDVPVHYILKKETRCFEKRDWLKT